MHVGVREFLFQYVNERLRFLFDGDKVCASRAQKSLFLCRVAARLRNGFSNPVQSYNIDIAVYEFFPFFFVSMKFFFEALRIAVENT